MPNSDSFVISAAARTEIRRKWTLYTQSLRVVVSNYNDISFFDVEHWSKDKLAHNATWAADLHQSRCWDLFESNRSRLRFLKMSTTASLNPRRCISGAIIMFIVIWLIEWCDICDGSMIINRDQPIVVSRNSRRSRTNGELMKLYIVLCMVSNKNK